MYDGNDILLIYDLKSKNSILISSTFTFFIVNPSLCLHVLTINLLPFKMHDGHNIFYLSKI